MEPRLPRGLIKFAHLVTLVRRYVSTKLEVSTVFLLRENQRYGTDGRGATLNAIPSDIPVT